MKNAVDLTAGNQAKRALWWRRIEQWKRSGKTQREFCAQHSIALATFQWWRARLRASGVTAAKAQSLFVPLSVVNEPVAAAGVIEVELRSERGYVLRVKLPEELWIGCSRRFADVRRWRSSLRVRGTGGHAQVHRWSVATGAAAVLG